MMLVPKAPTHFNNLLEASEDQIRFTGQCRHVQAVPKTHAMHEPSHKEFRRCMFRADCPHVCRTAFSRERIHHNRILPGNLDQT
jgi:hypothetical protein